MRHAERASAPTVSVVIPSFELGQYLDEAVRSVETQTRPPDEIVVVDDESTDPLTLDVLDRLERRGIRVLRCSHGGVSAARNHGIASTGGTFVLCLDGDDVLLPRYLEQAVPTLMEATDAGMCGTRVELFGERQGSWGPAPFSVAHALWSSPVPSASLFRRQCWEETGGYKEVPSAEDWEFWLSIVERGWKWVDVPEILYRYRVRTGSISSLWRARRPELIRRLVDLHRDLYQAHWVDAFIEMDATIGRLYLERERVE